MTKVLPINTCGNCCFFLYNKFLEKYICMSEQVGLKIIKDKFTIPDWCPLENYITNEGMLAK